MNTLRLALLAFAVISPGSLMAQDPEASPDSPPETARPPILRQQLGAKMGQQFDEHDYDHDGYISWQEWEKSNLTDPEFQTNGKIVFDHVDTNHDNRLARQEMVDWTLRIFDCIDENRDATMTDAEGQKNGERCFKSETGISATQEQSAD